MAKRVRKTTATARRRSHARTRQPAAAASGPQRRAERGPARRLRRVSPRTLCEGLLHAQTADRPAWRLLPLVLVLAFAVRAAVALAGDFVLHADEIMQYLEPAHRLAFGNGVIYWEYFYGARSWLVPGVVAGVLKLFEAVGLGQPWWYVDGVKLVFCVLSLAIPGGMYVFARRHFSETAARLALVAGAFWYELAGFAHKPLTEFVATAPLVGLLALSVRPATDRSRVVWLAAGLAVVVGAIRMQYAPIALAVMAIVFVRTRRKLLLAGAAATLCCAVGVFDALTWDGGLFHSYVTNLRFNLMAGKEFVGADPAYKLLWWLTVAAGGLSVLCVAGALRSPRRYGLLLGLIALALLTHAVPAHKEYRFIFAVIPLWLLIGADLGARGAAWVAARLPARRSAARWTMTAAAALFAAVSCAGMLKALPAQVQAYRDWSHEATSFGFVRGHDPLFAAYRYLARTPGVHAVWQIDRGYSSTPGYYYLHRAIPLYDLSTGRTVNRDLATISSSVSHLVSAKPDLTVPGYSLEREFGAIRILRRDATELPVRRWREYTPVVVFDIVQQAMQQIDAEAPAPPANAGIRFDAREQPAEYKLEQAANALLSQQRFAEALATYREALQIRPDYAPAHAGMGKALFLLERYEEALDALAQGLALQPDWALTGALRRLMGRAAWKLERADAAAGHFERALQFDPRDTEALDRLALVRFEQRRYKEALGLYRRLAEINPDIALTHANLATTLYRLDRVDEAVESYEHALSLDPSLESAHAALEQIRTLSRQTR